VETTRIKALIGQSSEKCTSKWTKQTTSGLKETN